MSLRLQVKKSAPALPIKLGSDRLRLQKTDFDTKHLKNLNFNKKSSINLDFVHKTGKNIGKYSSVAEPKLFISGSNFVHNFGSGSSSSSSESTAIYCHLKLKYRRTGTILIGRNELFFVLASSKLTVENV